MLKINPRDRISAIDALMHDFCIISKQNYKGKLRKSSACIPSAENFLSQYSLDCKSRQRSFSHGRLAHSLQKMNQSSLICISTEDGMNNQKNTMTLQDLNENPIPKPIDPFRANALMLLGGYEKNKHEPLNPNSSAITKKSKFADAGY